MRTVLAQLMTSNELRVNLKHVKRLMFNQEMTLGYPVQVGRVDSIRDVEDIRVGINEDSVQVIGHLDRTWRTFNLEDIVVR
jgi:hypothetical protein